MERDIQLLGSPEQVAAKRKELEAIRRTQYQGGPVRNRFWPRVIFSDGCWEWTGAVNRGSGQGYATFNWTGGDGRKKQQAHRFAWEDVFGPIPDGLDLDHLCRNRACVNPFHLEPVTRKENVRRGMLGEVQRARQAAKTHCPRGHPYSGDNLYDKPYPSGRPHRRCKTCAKELRKRAR